MKYFHIAKRPTPKAGLPFTYPNTTLCGKYTDSLSAYLYPDQVEGFDKAEVEICEDCYNDPDYPLLLLADIGEGDDEIDWNSIFHSQGTQTGRLNYRHPNVSNIAEVLKEESRKLQKETDMALSKCIISHVDYSDLEMRMAISCYPGKDDTE